jgi:glycerate kinase
MAREIVIAPDSFKGTATAAEVASAIAQGWHSVCPGDSVRLLPMADGGEGTLDAMERAVVGAARRPVTVRGPLEDDLASTWLRLPNGTGVVELAASSGITLLPRLHSMSAHSLGFGQTILAALNDGVDRLLLAIGGSSSTDGGIGMLSALGARFTDRSGTPIVTGARGLATEFFPDLHALVPLPRGGARVLSDVTNPLLGPHGAARTFGPQKGASAPADVERLERGLERVAHAFPQVDPNAPGTGAAGGVGFGLALWGAQIHSGASAVAEAIGLCEAAASADFVITGEGRFDAQTAGGKVATVVAGLAPGRTLLVAGSIDAPPGEWFRESISLTELAGSADAAKSDPLRFAFDAGALLARSAAGQTRCAVSDGVMSRKDAP